MSDPYDPAGPDEQLLAERDASGAYTLTSWAPGPAGIAVADLPGDVEVAVDLASPTIVTSVSVPELSGRSEAVVDALFGHGTTEEMVRATERMPGRAVLLPGASRYRARVMSDPRGPGSPAVRAAGGFALLSELLADPDAAPFERLVALLESIELLRRVPAVADPFLLRRLAEGAAAEIPLSPMPDGYIAEEVARLAHRAASVAAPEAADELTRYAELCESASSHPVAAMAAAPMSALRVEREHARPLPRSEARRYVKDDIRVSYPHPHVVRVDAEVDSLVGERWWARVFRRDDGLVLGMAPVRGDTPTAEMIVAPQLGNAALVVDFTTDPLEPPRGAATAIIQEAIATGRAAALADRRRDPEAARLWAQCASLWQRAGDHRRATLAMQYSGAFPKIKTRRRGRDPQAAGRLNLLVDQLAR
jgi:hypothetical protein